MLATFGRSRLISIGDLSGRTFDEMCDVLGLSLEHQAFGPIDVSAQNLLATLFFVDEKNQAEVQGQIVKMIVQNTFEYGVFLVVASRDRKIAITVRANSIAAVAMRQKPRILRLDLADFAAIGPSDDPRLAGMDQEKLLATELYRVLREHQTEPPADSTLQITGDTDEEFWEQDRILLQRAFNGFTKLHLSEEAGGRSQSCVVWRVEANKGPNVLEPFIAKTAIREDLVHEFNTYRDMVRDHVPFPFRAPLLESRFVKGGSRALLISAFVSRAQRFDQYLGQTTHPELAVASLFHNALANWRRNSTPRPRMSVGASYVAQQEEALRVPAAETPDGVRSLLPKPEHLAAAYDDCQRKKLKSKSPIDLWNQLRLLPEGDYYICQVHGDLNIRNVFVRWNVSDAILIDFSHAGLQDFLARDPAKLETSIALTCANSARRLLSLEMLRQLYQSPLLPMRRHFPTDGRIEAIRQIRRQSGGEGISNHEYGVVVACHLLRYAGVSPEATDSRLASRRALSYSLACSLIENSL